MPTYILDTSVAVKWFHRSQELHVAEAKRVWDDLSSGKISVILPDILFLELLNVFIKGKNSSSQSSYSILSELYKSPVTITEMSLPVLEIAARLMEKYNIASYDAYFLALAQYENCKLISDDQKAHGKIKDGTVIMLGQYQ
ncbi:MAG: type II toxin-antitoxin system VapC family toxin [Candidatus Levybacteria bacterium]|nr:type II toxin-antitoxin system VapC family toxin [Candidatus Levybacteria bacterium]